MDKIQTLGEKLKFYRKRIGISQCKLEINTNIAFGTISRIETNKIKPQNPTIFKIAKALKLNKVEVADLLGVNFFIENYNKK